MNETPIVDNFQRYMQMFLAVAITCGFFGVIAALMWAGNIPASVKDIMLVMLGALLASWKEVTGYYFGSSSGSASKDARNDALTAQIVANPIATPAATIPAAGIKIDDSDPLKVREVK